MKELIISIVGYFLIYMAVFSFRKGESRIKIISVKYLVIMLLVIIGTYILKLT